MRLGTYKTNSGYNTSHNALPHEPIKKPTGYWRKNGSYVSRKPGPA